MSVDTITATKQYLTFKLDEEFFTIPVQNVREILEYTKITKMPDAPSFMCGIINVRGRVIPVIDLRLKFGMTKTIPQAATRIVVLDIEREDGRNLIIGSLADSVKEVIEVAPEQIEPPPDMGTRWKRDYVIGIEKYQDEFIMLIDVKKVFSSSELTAFNPADVE